MPRFAHHPTPPPRYLLARMMLLAGVAGFENCRDDGHVNESGPAHFHHKQECDRVWPPFLPHLSPAFPTRREAESSWRVGTQVYFVRERNPSLPFPSLLPWVKADLHPQFVWNRISVRKAALSLCVPGGKVSNRWVGSDPRTPSRKALWGFEVCSRARHACLLWGTLGRWTLETQWPWGLPGRPCSQPCSQHESLFQGRPCNTEGRGKWFLLRLVFNNSSVLPVPALEKAHLPGHTFTQTHKRTTLLAEWTEV